jgi:hypothetical protein
MEVTWLKMKKEYNCTLRYKTKQGERRERRQKILSDGGGETCGEMRASFKEAGGAEKMKQNGNK